MRFALTTGLLATVFCASPAATATAPAPQGTRPTLLLFITVDQMRADYLDKWASQFTGGLKRLSQEGAFFTNAHQDHAITETAPGHASTMSGRFPRSTGISRNLAGVNDSTPLLSGRGLGASPARFRGTTVTDWLTAANPATRALSVSYKDRGAILPIGRSKQQVYWYAGNQFTTSKWYADSLPDWIKAYNNRFPRLYAGKTWDLLLPASNYPEPDSVPAESAGRNFQFPYRLQGGDTAAFALPNFPWLDETIGNLALEGLQRLNLGRGPHTDVLAVSFSTTDLIGHRYGPDSRELHDQILRLDRYLGVFLDSLFKLRSQSQIIIALTADHGVTPFNEIPHPGRYEHTPERVPVGPAMAAARAVLRAAKVDTMAAELESGALTIDRLPGLSKAVIDAAADSFVAAARRIPGVMRAERFSELAKYDQGKDPIARRWLHMFGPDVPAEAIIVRYPGSNPAGLTLAMHGSPHDDDSHVPILFYGAPFKPGRYGEFARTVDIAPTLAEVLGVPPTEPLDGHVLKAAIK